MQFHPFVKLNVNVNCYIRPESWVKHDKKNAALLKHEQGHYDIGVLCALQFKKRAAEQQFSKSLYKLQVESLFQQTLQEFLIFERQYDRETRHYRNVEKQKEWNQYFEDNLGAVMGKKQ
eukprot:TRINITY_DN18332_c0_g1_i1.p3 TRINITY_DN18332_c0_g1~~TRINITY_DN18332_c0_g1_i1.p3  ORF type:complete len:119 (-),score=16.23 TRINITY_DN18332_c0_g1_i1:14-370(-)